MRPVLHILSCTIVLFLFIACGTRPFLKPHGEKIGSCKGYLKPEGRSKFHFTFELYKESDGDFTAYMSIPRRGVRYGKVEDIDFDNNIVRVELSSPHRVYQGTLIKDGLVIEGMLEPWIGNFKIELED